GAAHLRRAAGSRLRPERADPDGDRLLPACVPRARSRTNHDGSANGSPSPRRRSAKLRRRAPARQSRDLKSRSVTMVSGAPNTLSSPLPQPESTDGERVTACLETANALWAKGDIGEAVRWLQRGADAAEEDGNDARALALARLAADLRTAVGDSMRPSRPSSEPPVVRPTTSRPPVESLIAPAANARKATPSPAPVQAASAPGAATPSPVSAVPEEWLA